MAKTSKNNDFSVIKIGGKQYLVEKQSEILVDKLPYKSGKKIKLEALLINKGKSLKLGYPVVKEGIDVEIIGEIKDKKVLIFKHKAKKRYRRKVGFRAQKTKIKIKNF